jgi:hypothetical protein
MRRTSANVIALVLLLLALSVITGGVLLANRQSDITPEVQTAISVETSIRTPEVELTASVPTATIPWYVDLPPTERAVEEFKEVLRQSDIQTVTAMAAMGITPPPLPTLDLSGSGVSPLTNGRRPAGAGDIIDLRLHLPFQKSFEVQNVWTAPLEDVQVIVYVGYDRSTPNQGGVYVQWGEIDNAHPTRNNEYYPAPEEAGPLRVVDAVGTALVLADDNGIQVQFDVLTGRYGDPSATPGPTSITTPEPYPAPATPAPVTALPATAAPLVTD